MLSEDDGIQIGKARAAYGPPHTEQDVHHIREELLRYIYIVTKTNKNK